MSQLMDIIERALGNHGVQSIANQLGESPEKTNAAISQALPMMIASLSSRKNATSGWGLLSAFLDKNHDGSILDDLVAMALGSGAGNRENSAAASRILGASEPAVQRQLEQSNGLSSESSAKLLAMLAPVVVGALANMQRTQNLDEQGLNQALTVEREKVATKSPESVDFISKMLDANHDGSISDDLAKAGGGILQRLFS